jgi:hypothetical protein
VPSLGLGLHRGQRHIQVIRSVASARLPKAEQQLDEWQTAIGCLIGAAEGRDFLMHARIGVMKALNRHVERVFDPSRKDRQRVGRKLKRDE